MSVYSKKANRLFLILLALFLKASFTYAQGDDCSTALTLTSLSNYCSANGAYTTVAATNSSNTNPSCWTNANSDVWFQFTAVGSDVVVTINGNTVASNGTLNNPNLALYSGSCGGLTQLACATVNLVYPNTANLFENTLTIGNTYYIRVNGNSSTGTFQLCINNFQPVATNNQDCATASPICSKNTISINSFNGTGSFNNEVGGSCIPSEINSNWYTWVAANNGTLTLSITPNNQTDDIDFFVFELVNGNCTNKNVIRCCSSSCLGSGGSTGLDLTETDTIENPGCFGGANAFIKYIDMIAGNTYGILINNCSGQGGYSISFGGTGDFVGPVPAFTVSDTVVCGLGTPVTFINTSTDYDSLLWHFGNNASIDTTSSESPQTVSFSTPGIHTVSLETFTANGCDVLAYKIIQVFAPPVVDLGPDTLLCPGESITLNAGNIGCSYSWTPNGETTQTITTNTTNTYKVDVSNVCFTVSDSVMITSLTTPDVSIGADTILCAGDSMELDAGYVTNHTAYMWFPDGETTQTIMISKGGTYAATVTIRGCVSGTDSINIAYEDCELMIPNIFSPNSDNINDYFFIKGMERHPNSLLIIYNRWGTKIYETDDYKNDWNASQHSEGVYYYILKISPNLAIPGSSTEYTTKSGFVTVIR